MPGSDSLQPILNSGEKAAVKESGGWTQFTQSYGMNPWDAGTSQEGKAIASAMASYDAQQGGQNTGGKK
ncbi:hypothetical protein L198_02536 [Cryptococcus wingfieldii CBS 7118]|uniref:Uncharacterized protein n=1 Tax=Cryptococcus wingfieldii CBS 7118 TaxID=1295528 RepID=A0A1E3JLT4_9TREE|nr:hypothetical protein L198_02536 [Cryptococcus wingfieldii CBS 7118]ODO01810.1 hypothetical protein L198_02536 [Cryptococcus wingfieldii CBS 7118]